MIQPILNRLSDLQKQLDVLTQKTARAEWAGGVIRRAVADLVASASAGSLAYATDGKTQTNTTGVVVYFDGTNWRAIDTGNIVSTTYILPVAPNYTVAALPVAGIRGRYAFATNGRKTGEGAGAGTGVLCYDDSVAWRRVDDGTTVAA